MALHSPALLEALLFASGEALDKKTVSTLLEMSPTELSEAVGILTTALKGHGITLIETETELELRTAPETSNLIATYRESELSRDIGKASLETLAIILYKNGATRSEIDYIRGVNSSTALRSLQMRALIEKSEDASDKRKIRYQPTIEALAHLGVSRKEDLPRYKEFTEGMMGRVATADTV
jgi:segregation and condensation protein B